MAGMDPEITARLAREVAEIYGDAQNTMLAKVSRRLARGIDYPGWAEAKRADIRRLRHEALIDIQRLDRRGPDAVRVAIEGGYQAGLAAADAENIVSVASGFAATNVQAVEALAAETIGAVASTHAMILRSTLDIYRSVINEAALRETVTGAMSRREAAQRALAKLAGQGIKGFTDAAGRQWALESYVEMATRTGTGHAMLEGTLNSYKAAGHDLVIISDAPEECRVCRPFEGRIFSISGKDKRYPSLASARAAGLFHCNCRHRAHRYIPGLTRPMEHTEDPVSAEERVRQRELERRVRQRRREKLVAQEWTTEDQAVEAAKELERATRMLKKAKADLSTFITEHNRKRLRYRETLGAI